MNRRKTYNKNAKKKRKKSKSVIKRRGEEKNLRNTHEIVRIVDHLIDSPSGALHSFRFRVAHLRKDFHLFSDMSPL